MSSAVALAHSNVAQMELSVQDVLFALGCAFMLHVFVVGAFRVAALESRVAALEARVEELLGEVQQLDGGIIHMEDDVNFLLDAVAPMHADAH